MLDLAAFKKDNKDMYDAIVAEVQGDMDGKIKTARQEGKAEGVANGAAAECQRVIAVKAQSIPGHEALVETMVADGKTTGPEAAQAIILAENKARGTAADDIDAEGNRPAKVVIDAPAAKKTATGSVTAATIKADWEASAEVQEEFLDNFESYAAFRKADAAGQIKLRAVQA